MSECDVVGFDAYGTLFDITGEDWGPPELVAAMRAKQLQYSWLASLMGEYREFRELTRAALEYTLAQQPIAVHADDVMESMLHITLYPDARAALERISEHSKLAILSNGDPDSLEALLANAGIRDLFGWVVSAHEVRTFKPSPAVYEQLLLRTSSARDKVLFVSSNGWDAAGAARYGLRVAWVNRTGGPAERIGGDAELVVKDLAELAAQVAH